MTRCESVGALLLLLLGMTIGTAGPASATAGDYDGDGKADLALIDADAPEDKTTVFVRRSSDGAVRPYVFYPYGDFVIAGQFFGGARTYPGIVSVSKKKRPLQWRIKRPNGRELVFNFGIRGDQVPNQGDLDCDGTADYSYVRNTGNGALTWFAKLSSNPSTVQSTVFGAVGDRVYTGDVDGDGCAEIISLSPSFVWSARPFGGVNVIQLQWGAPGDIPLVPADLDGDDLPDFTIVRRAGSKHVAYTKHGNGTDSTGVVGTTNSVPMIGNFFGANTFGWFTRSKGRFTLQTLSGELQNVTFGNSRRGVVRPDGTAVQEGDSDRFGTGSAAPLVTPTPPPASGPSCTGQIRRTDGSGGFKNNPENSKGTIKIIFPNSMTGEIKNVKAYAGNNLFDTLKFAPGNEWGDRERYYGTKSLGSYPNNLLIMATMDNGERLCVTLPDPEEVYD